MNKIKPFALAVSLISLALCNVIYQSVFHMLSVDGHQHSAYSIIWAPNAYMVFFLWAFYKFIPKWISFFAVFMTVIGFNLVFIGDNNYPVGMGTYLSSMMMYAVNNGVFILGFICLIHYWNRNVSFGKNNDVMTFLSLHIGGAVCTLIASLSVLMFPSSSIQLVFELFSANIMSFIFFTSYLFLSEKFIPRGSNVKVMNFSLLVTLSSVVFYVVNVYFHSLSKETFALILMGAFICLFIQGNAYLRIIISSLVSALFAAVNVALDLTIYDFILFYGICISTSVILIMRKKEIAYVDTLKKTVHELEQSRLIDPLTGLLNREGFKNELKKNLGISRKLYVAYADLDKFKEINDIMGHGAGDAILKVVSLRMTAVLGASVPISRQGGDEFSFIIPGRKGHVASMCQKLIEHINEPITIGSTTVSVGISVGISVYPADSDCCDELIDKADVAMYSAKKAHLRLPVFFEEKMEHKKNEDNFYLYRTFKIDEIQKDCYVVFQPLHDVISGKIVSFEALIRHNTLETADVIDWAEEYGYMNEIFKFVSGEAAKFIQKTGFSVAVNISPSQLIYNGEDVLDYIFSLKKKYKTPSWALSLEVTESVPILEHSVFISIVKKLKDMKVKIFLDDFGTGYAFFSTLTIGGFDAIKIDKNLVKDIYLFLPTQRLLSSIVSYAHSTNMRVIAEGVECIQELEILKTIGVNAIQGYLFSRPLKEDDAIVYIRTCDEHTHEIIKDKVSFKGDSALSGNVLA